MKKNIIILSDGTGNSAAKRNKTNVWRLYDALDLHLDEQVAFYDDGVGSQEFLLFKLLGGAFGVGLKRNVLELYQFLCRNFETGDRIYLFGFSRGAFTVRLLAGMIAFCGVYKDFDNEKELEKITKDNYNAFRSKFFKGGWLTKRIRKIIGSDAPHPTDEMPDIEFVGVWDTVDAYGLPMDWMAELFNRFIYPLRFPDFQLPDNVKKACHALSVDDERRTFHPLLWDERDESDRLEQVWFPGVHSDIGGGYPKYNLALISLDWMISKVEGDLKAKTPGLYFIERCRNEFYYHSDWNGTQHDSRALFGTYYRYSPRDIHGICTGSGDNWLIEKPKIHRSVFDRITENVIPYAPTGIPETYEVVTTRGIPKVYETSDEKEMRIREMQPALKAIRQRTRLYHGFLLISVMLLASPMFLGASFFKGYLTIPMVAQHWFHTGLFKGLAFILPAFAGIWLVAWENSPLFFYPVLLIFLFFVWAKMRLHEKTQTHAANAWIFLKRKQF